MRIVVPPDSGGERLDRFLAGVAGTDREPSLAGLSRARLQALIAAGKVTLDGVAARAAQRLRGGEQILLEIPPPVPIRVEPEPMPLDILYEDADLVVVAKPAGLAVHPGAGRLRGTLVGGLLAHCKDLSGVGGALRPGIVHRLDRGTSGVLVAAKNDRAHVGVARQFAARQVEKRYVAFVLGTPSPAQATLSTLYGRHPTMRQRFTSQVKTGKRAITRYAVVASGGGVARLDVWLATGRTHQIRVHLAERRHPIVGDPLYGGRCYGGLDSEVRTAAEGLDHQALHAALLAFRHPVTGVPLRFESSLPPDLVRLAEALARAASRAC